MKKNLGKNHKNVDIFTFLAISYSDLATTMPFENSIDVFDLRGDHLINVFEHAAEGKWQSHKQYWETKPKFFIQTSGEN